VARKARLFEDNVDHYLVLTGYGRDWLVRELGVDPERITIGGCAIQSPAAAADPGREGTSPSPAGSCPKKAWNC